MTSVQIDRLCQDWLYENYGKAMASEYESHSLLIPDFNSTDLDCALEELRQRLYFIFGPEQSFGRTDYYEARERLGLSHDRIPVPDVFVRAFLGTQNSSQQTPVLNNRWLVAPGIQTEEQ